jgi:enterochelin esterase-like enzyme
VKMRTKLSVATRVLLSLLLLPACSLNVEGNPTPESGGAGGASASSAGSGGSPVSGGAVGAGGSTVGTAGSNAGTASGGVSPGGSSGTGGSAAGSGGASMGGQGCGSLAGSAGMVGTAGTGGVDTGPVSPPHVTPQNATSVPAMYGNPVANPGKLTTKVMYPAYWYSANASSSEAYKSTPSIPKQTTPVMKPLNVYTPPGYDKARQYPLIVIMHGITDNENTWNERSRPNVATLFDNLITSKATKPFIAVFALGTVQNATGGYYAFGGELINDLLPFVEANYSVRKDRGSRAMAGFSFGGMQTLSIGLCAHLKEFAWFAGLNPAGPGTPSASDVAKYVDMQNPQMYPLYYFYVGVGNNDGTAGGSAANAANGLVGKSPNITAANFSFQNNIPGGHDYPTAEVSLYNFLRMAFAPN